MKNVYKAAQELVGHRDHHEIRCDLKDESYSNWMDLECTCILSELFEAVNKEYKDQESVVKP